jgi:hypothetical protein
VDALLEASEVLVVGNPAEVYRGLGPRLRPGQVLVDLVSAVDPRSVTHGEYLGIAW